MHRMRRDFLYVAVGALLRAGMMINAGGGEACVRPGHVCSRALRVKCQIILRCQHRRARVAAETSACGLTVMAAVGIFKCAAAGNIGVPTNR